MKILYSFVISLIILSACGDGLSKGAVRPVNGECNMPNNIKGNRGSNGWIYHTVHGKYYFSTYAEECFATKQDAEKAGYRAPIIQ